MEKLSNLPDFFLEKLDKQYGKPLIYEIIEGFSQNKKVAFRLNNLKSNKVEVEYYLAENDIRFEKVPWYDNAYIVINAIEKEIQELDIYKEGKIYLQNLSSMIPPLVLNAKENTDVLDMCAAPGGKTSEIAALCDNNVNITACELNRIRHDRLQYNMNKQGVKSINIMRKDSRYLDDFFSFDSILLDSPCSGSGTINLMDERTYNKFSEELVLRSCRFQEQLINKATKLLKKNGELVYSTCSILEDENENIVNKILSKGDFEIVPIDLEGVPKLPCKIDGALCVKPTELYEGFFVAKLRRRQ